MSFGAAPSRRLDRLGDLVEEHLDLDALPELATAGAPHDVPFLALGSE